MTDCLKAFSRHETASVGVQCWGYDLGSLIFTDTAKKQVFLMASFKTQNSSMRRRKEKNNKKKLAALSTNRPVGASQWLLDDKIITFGEKCSQKQCVWGELSVLPLCINALNNDLLLCSSCLTSHFKRSHNFRKCIQFNGHVNMQGARCPLTHYVAEKKRKKKKKALTLHFQPLPAAKSGKVNATLIYSSQSLKKKGTGAASWTACSGI